MARPVKNSLNYFPLDVDIFEDEKVIPISSEYGAKGDCVIIRVLCAVYRNGYFAECSEAFKYKIAKQSNLSHSLVSEVISGLVKWGFFDKAVFDSFGVLTSKGIQQRWLDATKRRVKGNLDYWLLAGEKLVNVKDRELLYTETTLNDTETTQKKREESKIKKKEKTKEKPASDFLNLENSNLYRKPVVPAREDVEMFFFRKCNDLKKSKEMASSFYDSLNAVGWFWKGSPVINFTFLADKFYDGWQRTEKNKKNGNKGRITADSGTFNFDRP